MAYKYKTSEQICQVCSSLHDAYFSLPSLTVPCLFHSPVFPGQQATYCQHSVKALLQVWLPFAPALPGVTLLLLPPLRGGALGGGHTTQHLLMKEEKGSTPPQRTD